METPSTFERIRPLGNKVFVEVDTPKEMVLPSGIVIPATAHEAMERQKQEGGDHAFEGTVVAVGVGRMVGNRFVESVTKVGQRVLISERGSHSVPHRETEDRGKVLYRLWDDEVLAIVED
jgi:co-chaperonin GroES (HSP10)